MQGIEYRRRIFYYDTDAGGVVYHGNYLRFCEEARTDIFLRLMGMSIGEFADKYDVNFVVSRAHVEYRRPVPEDSVIAVRSYVEELSPSGVRTKYRHEIWVGGNMCTVVKLEIATISRSFRPAKPPKELIDNYRKAFGL